jgi:hypothetical protein
LVFTQHLQQTKRCAGASTFNRFFQRNFYGCFSTYQENCDLLNTIKMTESEPLLQEEKMEIPTCRFEANLPPPGVLTDLQATFTLAKKTLRGKFPQAIAHRGYKAANPENTMGAFKGAVDVGAHAIETDLHLSKDGVVVLSHVRTFQLHGCKPGQSL